MSAVNLRKEHLGKSWSLQCPTLLLHSLSGLQWKGVAGGTLCCEVSCSLVKALPTLLDKVQSCLTKHTRRFYCKRHKVMA